MPVPPSSKLQKRLASKLYEEFSGHDAEVVGSLPYPKTAKTYITLGKVSAIEYDTVRDGVREYYRHDFAHHASPTLLCVKDGKQLHFIGGAYDFTERGIVDRKNGARKNLTRIKFQDVVVAVGEINAIECGENRFEFSKKSRPLLCATYDGKQLYALGGAYTVEV